MLLIDYSNVAIAAIMVQTQYTNDFDENLCRHIIFNCLLSYRKKYPAQKKVVVACEGGNVWRRKSFPYYKASRKAAVESSAIDWTRLLDILNKVRDEIRNFMPYVVMQVPNTESDDVIATLVKSFPEPHAIIANDKDFLQLQRYPNVVQYSSRKGKEIKPETPDHFAGVIKVRNAEDLLKLQIITGDSGDGVPNILSDDDVFVVPEKRQKQIRKAKMAEWMSKDLSLSFDKDKIERNQTMIDFDRIPNEIHESIIDAFTSYSPADRSGILPYFGQSKLRNLIEEIPNF